MSSDQCHAPDCTVKRRRGAWDRLSDDNKGLYARGSPLARVPRAPVRADGMCEGVLNQTGSPFSLKAAITDTLTSLHQDERMKMEKKNHC